MMFRSVLRLVLGFLKVGIIGFGGGSALIPIIHNEIVAKSGAMSAEDYLKHTVVANITPGTLPVKLGATCGLQLTNPAGAVLAAYVTALPGVAGTVWALAFFAAMGPEAIDYLNHASIGITIFIVYLLLHYVAGVVADGRFRINATLCLLAFFLTSGREIREVVALTAGIPAHALGRPLFDLSMGSVMFLSLFGIAWSLLAGNKRILGVGVFLGLAYAVLSGGMSENWRHSGMAGQAIAAAMVAGVAILLRGKGGRDRGRRRGMKFDRSIAWAIAAFLLLPILVFVCAALSKRIPVTGRALSFLGDVAISSITSFGGGEAYVAVADSMFVQSGLCPAEMFYGRIVPVANALPGPILVKIAAAMGYVYGDAASGMSAGVLLAALCCMLAVGTCSAIALLVLNYYEELKHSVFMLSLKQYILPVICGTLMSTVLAMLCDSVRIAGLYGRAPLRVASVMACCVALMFWVTSRFKIHDIFLLLFWIAGSLVVMSR